MKKNMVILTGQGDTDVMIVDDEIYEWIESPYPIEEDYGKDPSAPQRVVDALEASDPGCEVSIGVSSYQNDRALQIGDAAEAQFFDMTAAFKYVRDNDIEIVRTWEGYIY